MSDRYYYQGNITNSLQGNVTNSAVSFGQNTTTSVVNPATPASAEEAALRADLEMLLPRLQLVAGELATPAAGAVTGAVDEVTQELAEPKPRWQRIQSALSGITPAVATLAKLAADVARITDAINPLIPH
jgi:hypothetical protein